jgi:hypothetical protein
MFLDKQSMLSEAQAVTASAVSANTIDLLTARDIAPGEDLSVFIAVDATATAAGAATVDFQFISSAAAALTSPTVLAATGPIGKAELTAGRKLIELKVPRAALLAQPVGQRYVGIQYVVATGPLTAGAFTAGVVVDFQDQKQTYASGFVVA